MIYTITFHRANNYGAVLQAYALQKVLLLNNYKTAILDYDNLSISGPYKVFSSVKKNMLKKIYHFIYQLYYFIPTYKKNINFNKFRRKMILSKHFKHNKYIISYIRKNDILIVGSDQIWNPQWTSGFDPIYFLDIHNTIIKKISYSASCGDPNVIKHYNNEFKKYLSNFDMLSVRENHMKENIGQLIDKKVTVTLDPTLLLNKEEWNNVISDKRLINEKYIFTYEAGNPSDSYYKSIIELQKKTGYKIVYFGKKNSKYGENSISYYSAGPIEWLNLLKYSEYVITTSFHGTAFSIIFNKNFYVSLTTFPERITNLLNKLGLNKRIINDNFDFNKKINWNSVNKKIEIERKKSQEWLINAIEK